MLLLTGFADETGHSDDPVLHFAGMAGLVAPLEKWKDFEKEWQPTLDEYGLKDAFHMKDFAHFKGQFESWRGDEDKRRSLFGKLIALIVKTEAMPVGAIVSIEGYKSLHEEQQSAFHSPFMVAFQQCTRGMAIEGMFDEKVAMVYSYNQEYGVVDTFPYSVNQAGTAESLWHNIKAGSPLYGKFMGAYSSSTPKETKQLQAADILAYELSKEFENRIRRPDDQMRFGLREILRHRHAHMIRLLDRKELLRIVKESNFPCQAGIEELSNNQMVSAAEQMNRWMAERLNRE